MPVIARKGTGWKGVEDLLGKKVAGNAGQYVVTGPLLDLGHNPAKEIEWIQIAVDSDKLAAVINGVTDYAVMGTGRNYAIQNMKDQLEVVTYCSDLTPNYSCCRMETRDEFIQKNPIAIKLLLKCLIRAQAYYESHKSSIITNEPSELTVTVSPSFSRFVHEPSEFTVTTSPSGSVFTHEPSGFTEIISPSDSVVLHLPPAATV